MNMAKKGNGRRFFRYSLIGAILCTGLMWFLMFKVKGAQGIITLPFDLAMRGLVYVGLAPLPHEDVVAAFGLLTVYFMILGVCLGGGLAFVVKPRPKTDK